MIPNQEKTINISGSSNLGQARSQQMGLDSASLPHLMRVLTNLYSDPEMAVIREYSTNAYDSHVEAGKGDVPIHVSLPNVFASEFIVRDFGVGLSEEEVFNVFGLYGASTKRESNEYVGQLGLGCKSALTFTNQFSLTAIKDGVKCVFSVHLDELGVGKITKLHEELTDSGNGVEVAIPVKEVHSFNRKAKRFYRFFPVMPKFIGGVAFPEEMKPEVVMEIEDGVRVIKSVGEDDYKDYIVMGGVGYPFRYDNASMYERIVSNGTIVIDAPIGSVDFTPSREELHMTARTKKFIEDKYSIVKAKVRAKMENEINKAADVWEFHELLGRYGRDLKRLGVPTMNYRGVEYDVTGSSYLKFPGTSVHYSINGERLSIDHNFSQLYLNSLPNYAIVINEEDTEPTSYINTKIKQWIIANSRNIGHNLKVILVPSDFTLMDEYRAKFNQFITLNGLKKQVKTYNKKPNNSKKKLYDLVDLSDSYYRRNAVDYTKTTVDEGEPTIYVIKSELKQDVAAFKRVSFKDVNLYAISKAQEKAFLKAYPAAIHASQYAENMARSIIDELDANEEIRTSTGIAKGFLERNLTMVVDKLPLNDWAQFEDKDLQRIVKAAKVYKQNHSYSRDKDVRFARASNYLNLAKVASVTNKGMLSESLTKLIKKYDTLGEDEVKEINSLYLRLKDVYPLLLNHTVNVRELIDYANRLAKGE